MDEMRIHLIIPDTQVKPDVNLEHLGWLGKYIVDIKPDVIVHLGDHFDMPSLSSYDKGTAAIEGKRVQEDIEVGKLGLDLILEPMKRYNNAARKNKKAVYSPELHFLMGNHEDRVDRYINTHPELQGYMSIEELGIESAGFTRHKYMQPVNIDGILYSHYFANPMSGRPYSGRAAGLLQRVGKSFVMGHRQELDYTCRELCDGSRQMGLVAGAFYQHDEGYKGPQGNKHWRGVVVLHEVRDGWGDAMFVSLDYLSRKYGNGQCK
jgi:hypothetical protein